MGRLFFFRCIGGRRWEIWKCTAEPHDFYKLLILICDIAVILFFVRKLAVGAVLDAFFCNAEISSAFCAEGVERAVAEETIEIVRIGTLVAGEIFAFFVTEEGVFFVFPDVFIHSDILRRLSNIKNRRFNAGQIPDEGRCCFEVDNASFKDICGGNEFIRSSIACHLIMPWKQGGHCKTVGYNSYEQANSIKNACFQRKQTTPGDCGYHRLVVTLYTEVKPRHTKQVSWLQDHHAFSPSHTCSTMDY